MRPSTCLDGTCVVLFSTFNADWVDKGGSFSCWGRMDEPRVTPYREVEHRNTHSHCVYTPLKGVIRFFICHEDISGDLFGMRALLIDTRRPECFVCQDCGCKSMPIYGFEVTEYLDGDRYCIRCAIRNGKWVFNEEKKEWERARGQD